MQQVSYLTDISWLSVLLICGIVASVIAYKAKIPDILLLILVGIIFSSFIGVPTSFLTTLSIFALVMIIFEATSKFRLKDVNVFFPFALKLAGFFFLFNIILLTLFTHLMFNWVLTINALLVSAMFAALMSGTSSSVVLPLLGEKKQRIVEVLELESIINTPFIILIPLVIIDLYQGALQSSMLFKTFSQSVMTGVGTGLVLGMIIFGLMKKKYLKNLSALVLIAGALITYTLSEYLGGSGVLGVTTLGLLFGIYALKEKEELQKFSGIFTNFLRIIAFILLGVMIREPLSATPLNSIFFIKSGALFLIYLLIRYLSVSAAFYKIKTNFKEKMFMTLNTTKGMDVAIVMFILISLGLQELSGLLSLSFLFVLYSITLSSIIVRFSSHFLTRYDELEKKKDRKLKHHDKVRHHTT